MEKIKTAFIGVGYRGKQLLQLLQTFPVFEVVAVADPGIEGVDMAGAAGPRHFKARNGEHAACI